MTPPVAGTEGGSGGRVADAGTAGGNALKPGGGRCESNAGAGGSAEEPVTVAGISVNRRLALFMKLFFFFNSSAFSFRFRSSSAFSFASSACFRISSICSTALKNARLECPALSPRLYPSLPFSSLLPFFDSFPIFFSYFLPFFSL